MSELCTRDALLYRPSSIRSLVEEQGYQYSMLSMNKRWYIGHMTECFLPDELFEELLVHATKEMNLEMDAIQLIPACINPEDIGRKSYSGNYL